MRQYTALLGTEGITLHFTPDAIDRLADVATMVNERTENIGARRLHTVMEKLLDNVSFDAPDLVEKELTIDARVRGPHAERNRAQRRSLPIYPLTMRTFRSLGSIGSSLARTVAVLLLCV